MALDPRFLQMEWQNGFEATLDDRVALSDEYIPMTPVPNGNFGRLVLEDTSKENFEVIRYNRKDSGGVYVETANGGIRNEDGTSSGVHPRGARVRGNITAQDLREVQEAVEEVENLSPIGFANDAFGDGVVNGLAITHPPTGRVADISAGVAYIDGQRVVVAAPSSRTYTATKTTYIILSLSGVLSYAEITIGAAAPALPANSIFIGTITTDATKITANTSMNRGVVKADNIDFPTLPLGTSSKQMMNTSQFTTSSSTMATKLSTTLDKGKYFVTYTVVFANGPGNANGETNSRIFMGGVQYAPMIGFLPAMTYTSSTNSGNAILDIPADGTLIELQTSVNWPSRGTFTTSAYNAHLACIRIG